VGCARCRGRKSPSRPTRPPEPGSRPPQRREVYTEKLRRRLTLALFICADLYLVLRTSFCTRRWYWWAGVAGEPPRHSGLIYGVEIVVVIVSEILAVRATRGTPRRARLRWWLWACCTWIVGTRLMWANTAAQILHPYYERQLGRPFRLPCWWVSGSRPFLACAWRVCPERIISLVVAQAIWGILIDPTSPSALSGSQFQSSCRM